MPVCGALCVPVCGVGVLRVASVLCFVFLCVLCCVFCVVCFVLCVLCCVFCVVCFVLCVLCCVFCVACCVLCLVSCVLVRCVRCVFFCFFFKKNDTKSPRKWKGLGGWRCVSLRVSLACVFCVRFLRCLKTYDVISFPKPGAQIPTMRKLRWSFLCFCSSLCAYRSGN